MNVEIVEVEPLALASVRRRVPWREMSREVPAMLGEVWALVRAGRLTVAPGEGHNVAVYHHPDADGAEVECGVRVAGPFDPIGEVRPGTTPGGRAAHVAFVGPYADLGKAHDAVAEHTVRLGLPAGVHWEIYGHPSDPPQIAVYRHIP